MNFPSPFHYVLHTIINNLLKQNKALETYWHISVNIIRGPLTMDNIWWNFLPA